MAKAQPVRQQTENLPAEVADDAVPAWLAKNSARGSENVTSDDVSIPRLEIVQSLSPIRKEDPEAKEGMLYNSVTGEIYGTEVMFIPVMFIKQWLVWKDRKKGGGFRGAFSSATGAAARIEDTANDGENPLDFDSVETPSHYGLIYTPDPDGNPDQFDLTEIVISMPRSKFKISRKFNAMVQLTGCDRFAKIYKVAAVEEKNQQNQDYYNLDIKPSKWCPEPVYREAEKLFERVKNTMITINHASTADTESDPSTEY